MTDERFNVELTAQDKTGEVLAKVTERMAKLDHEVERVEGHIHGLHQPHVWAELHEHVSVLHEGFGGLRESLSEVVGQAYELVPALAGLTAGIGLEKLFDITAETAERFAVLGHQAAAIGTTAEHLHDLHTFAEMSDTSVEKLDVALRRFNITLGEVSGGKNKDAAAAFAHLKLDPRQFHDSSDALIRLADVFQKTSNLKGGTEVEARFARVLFGRGGDELIPMLNHGGEWFKEHLAEAHAHNFNPDKEQAEANERYNESMKGLKAGVQSLHDEIGSTLTPVLLPVIKEMDEWTLANRDWIAIGIASNVKIVGENLKEVPWHRIGEDARWAADGIDYLVDHTTGWTNLLEGVAAYWTAKKVLSIFGEPVMKLKEIGEGAVALGVKLYELAAKWDGVAASARNAATAEEVATRVAPLAAAEGMVAAKAATHAAEAAPAAEVAGAAAGATVLGRTGVGRLAARALLGPEAFTAFLVHSLDSEDSVGQWIDARVPGAAAVDDWFARHTAGAIGRALPGDRPVTPMEQPGQGADPEDDLGLPFLSSPFPVPSFPPPPSSSQNAPAPRDPARVDGEIHVILDVSGAPPGARASAEVIGSRVLQPPQVNLGQSWPLGF